MGYVLCRQSMCADRVFIFGANRVCDMQTVYVLCMQNTRFFRLVALIIKCSGRRRRKVRKLLMNRTKNPNSKHIIFLVTSKIRRKKNFDAFFWNFGWPAAEGGSP